MKIIRAEHLGMCFGVRDAINLAIQQNQTSPLTILGDLVHNETVLSALRARGINTEQHLAGVRTETVMITAHGASQQTLARIRQRGLKVLEATCPLVHVAHRAVAELVEQGFHPVVIGRRDHVEVRGMTEDLHEFDVVLNEDDILQLTERPRFGIAAQTTQPIQRVQYLVNQIRERFPAAEVRFVDTVCRPTKQRQTAAVELARQCDLVIVLGGAHSNNTRELVATCEQHCDRVYYVQKATDLQPEWFLEGETIGLTAGTSTPDELIDQVEREIRKLVARQREAVLVN